MDLLGPSSGIWARQDSNLRPNDYESSALTTAPRARDGLVPFRLRNFTSIQLAVSVAASVGGQFRGLLYRSPRCETAEFTEKNKGKNSIFHLPNTGRAHGFAGLMKSRVGMARGLRGCLGWEVLHASRIGIFWQFLVQLWQLNNAKLIIRMLDLSIQNKTFKIWIAAARTR